MPNHKAFNRRWAALWRAFQYQLRWTMFEIKLEPMRTFRNNPVTGIQSIIIHTQRWVHGDNEYIIVHQDGLYNIYWRPLGRSLAERGDWSDRLPQPVHDLLSIRCAIEELGIMPEEEVL